jgi:hypothetical protein
MRTLLFVTLALMVAGSFAITQEFDFMPGTPLDVANPLPLSITAVCTITSTDASDILFAKMKTGSGTFDGKAVGPDGVSVQVTNGQKFTLTATWRAVVVITNQGATKVHAECIVSVGKKLKT